MRVRAHRFAHTCRWAYAETGWSRIASLAPTVLQCAEDGDSIAFKIVTSAAHEALEALVAVATKTRLKGQRFRLVLSGILPISDSDTLPALLSQAGIDWSSGMVDVLLSVCCVFPGSKDILERNTTAPIECLTLRTGGLLSKNSPFLDIILEGVKLRLPSADVAFPRVEPALGAALLAHDACFGATDSIGDASSSPFASPPRFLSRHETLPQSHGEW